MFAMQNDNVIVHRFSTVLVFSILYVSTVCYTMSFSVYVVRCCTISAITFYCVFCILCIVRVICSFKGTLHSKLTIGFFSWPKSIYYCDVSLTNRTFIKLELMVQGTHFYGDAGEFDRRRGINLGIWSQWLYDGTDDKLALVVTVASIVTGIMG